MDEPLLLDKRFHFLYNESEFWHREATYDRKRIYKRF